MSKNKLVILSDIHIGSNCETNWYQVKYHQPYLFAALDYVIANADSVKEVIFLGDLVDFWTYPVDRVLPNMEEVVSNNSQLFGSGGKISDLLTALGGNVSYVHGNHDMVLTQSDLEQIGHPPGNPIQMKPDIYYPLGEGTPDIVCTHGNMYSFSCAVDDDPGNIYTPLPVGYFITRSAAYFFEKHLKPGQTVADLLNGGTPVGWRFDASFIEGIVRGIFEGNFDVAKLMLDALSTGSGVSETQPIKMPGGTTATIRDAKNAYSDTFFHRVERDGIGYTADTLVDSDFENDLSGFVRHLVAPKNSILAVMGHTHVPVERRMRHCSNGVVYANSGFNCPPKPDMDKDKKQPTFVEIEILPDGYTTSIREVVKDGDTYHVHPDPAIPPITINK